jgi:protein tyrosine/serine phosphatase
VAGVVWNEVLKYRFIAKRWGVVVPGKVYRSGQISRWLIDDMIREHDLQVIVDLNGIEENDRNQEAEIAVAREMGLELHRFPLSGDGTGDISYYADAIAVMAECERAGRPVLVHCAAGAQRTGGVVAAYRILVEGRPPEEAFLEMKRYGWRPERDKELLPYLNAHLDDLAVMLFQRGVIDELPATVPNAGHATVGLAN